MMLQMAEGGRSGAAGDWLHGLRRGWAAGGREHNATFRLACLAHYLAQSQRRGSGFGSGQRRTVGHFCGSRRVSCPFLSSEQSPYSTPVLVQFRTCRRMKFRRNLG